MRTISALFFALCSLATTASATVVRLRSEEEMARAAALIARGRVLSVTARYYDTHVIVTDVRLAVERLLKGTPKLAQEVTLVQRGGCVDGVCQAVAGTSRFVAGERVVVFLEPGGGGWVEQGVGAGKYRIEGEGVNAQVTRELGEVTFAAVEGRAARVVQPPPPAKPEPLADFEARLLDYLVK